MKQPVFLSYDFGFQGDYPNLYKWLDSHKALECGDSFCRFIYDFTTVENMQSEEDTRSMIQEIRKDLTTAVSFSNTDRAYLVSEFYVNDSIRMAGVFLVGKRKQANPWDGASGSEEFQGIDE